MTTRTEATRNPQTNLTISSYCVAYLDILGGTNKMYSNKNHEILNKLNMVFSDSIEESRHLFGENTIFIKNFSDNILFAIKLEDNDSKIEDKISYLLNITANTILEALRYEFLMRGAITIGDFFHNDTLVYGKALVDAVKMEENFAIYPRIIAQEGVYRIAPQCFHESSDGLYVFKFLDYAVLGEAYSFLAILLKMLKECPDKKAEQKIRWAISYFNYYYKYLSLSIDKPQITDEMIEKALKT